MARKVWYHPLDPDEPPTTFGRIGFGLLMCLIFGSAASAICGWLWWLWAHIA